MASEPIGGELGAEVAADHVGVHHRLADGGRSRAWRRSRARPTSTVGMLFMTDDSTAAMIPVAERRTPHAAGSGPVKQPGEVVGQTGVPQAVDDEVTCRARRNTTCHGAPRNTLRVLDKRARARRRRAGARRPARRDRADWPRRADRARRNPASRSTRNDPASAEGRVVADRVSGQTDLRYVVVDRDVATEVERQHDQRPPQSTRRRQAP